MIMGQTPPPHSPHTHAVHVRSEFFFNSHCDQDLEKGKALSKYCFREKVIKKINFSIKLKKVTRGLLII